MSQLQVTGEAKVRDIQGPVVANSGVITALDGAASQYVRGDGTLADFPTSSGGGSSVSYYLNSSVSQGTIGGVAYRELSKEPIIGAGTDINISANGYVANYLTDANDPDLLSVPGGNFNCEFYFSVNSNNHNPSFYAELYKYDGTTFTLLGSSVGVPEFITQGTTIAPYYFAIPVPTSALALTDRLAIRIYVNVDGRTVTLHTENGHLCQVVTTFSKGMVSLNNLTDQSQNLTTGTSGSNFAIVSSGDTHTFNLPVASAANTGKLSSTDWSTFNNKQAALSFTAPLDNTANTISIPAATSLVDGYLDNLDWVKFNTAYNDSIISAAVTGTTTKTLTLNQQDGGTVTASWTDDNTDAVSSVFGRTGAVVAVSGDYNTDLVTEGTTNLYFTNARSRSALSFEAGSGAYNSTTGVITIPTNNNQITNGSNFITLGSLSGGTGITYNNTTGVITNSAPDQTVSLANGAGISVTGTYPSFTIASTITQYTDALARAALSFAAGSGAYNSTTGVITIPTNNNQITNGSNYITLASLSAGAGITYNNTTGVIASSITQYTDALARAAISLTTTGTSGAATYNSTTGVFNIPNYSTDLTGYVTLGTAQTITGKKIFSNTFGDGDPILVLTGTGSGNFQYATTTYNASLSAGQTIAHFIGRASSTRMSAYIGYQYAAADSNSNFLTLGHFNYDHIVKIYPTGQTIISGNLSAANLSGTNTGDQTLAGLGGIGPGFDTFGTLYARTAMTTYRGHNASAPNDAPIKSLSNTEDNWIYCDAANAQWGIYHRNIDTDLVVAGQPTLPGNSIAYIGNDVIASYVNLSNGNGFFRGSISASNFSGSSSGTNTGDQNLSAYLTIASASSTYLPLSGGALSGVLSINGGATSRSLVLNNSTNNQYIHVISGDYEAMTQYYNPTAGSWYTGIRTNAGLGSLSSYHIYSDTLGGDAFVLNTNGTGRFAAGVTATSFIKTGGTASEYLMADGSVTTSTAPANMVTTDTTQTITGQKTISRGATTFGGTTQSLLIDGAASQASITLNSQTTSYAYQTFAQGGVAKFEIGIVGTGGNGSLYMNTTPQNGETGASIYIRKSNGFVGVNDISPNFNLSVYNNADVWHTAVGGATGQIRFGGQTGSGGGVIQAIATNGLAYRPLLLQRDGGNAGIGLGSDNPSVRLDVRDANSSITNDPGNSQIRASASLVHFTSIGFDLTANVGYIQGVHAAVSWRPLCLNRNGGTESPVLIGTSSNNGVGKLQVNGRSTFNGNVFITGDTSVPLSLNNTTNNQYLYIGSGNYEAMTQYENPTAGSWYTGIRTAAGLGTTASYHIYSSIYGADVFAINTNGNARFATSVTATGFFDTSDSRLKIIIKDYEQPKGIENVAARMYLKNNKKELGYFAQDLQEILPSAVFEGEDGFLNLSYSQVHTAKIAYLEKEVAELKELIKTLL